MGQVGTSDSAVLTCSKFSGISCCSSNPKTAPFRFGMAENKAGGRGGKVSEAPVTVQNDHCILYEYYLATKMNLCFHEKDPNLLIN